MKVKFALFGIGLALLAVVLQGCGPSDTERVKKLVLPLDRTKTLGEAFDKWNGCKQKEWKEFKTEQGQRMVEFTCSSSAESEVGAMLLDYLVKEGSLARRVQAYMTAKGKTVSAQEAEKMGKAACEIKEDILTIQFTFTKDDNSVQIAGASDTVKWKDGKSSEPGKEDPGAMLNAVYGDDAASDLGDLKELLQRSTFDKDKEGQKGRIEVKDMQVNDYLKGFLEAYEKAK